MGLSFLMSLPMAEYDLLLGIISGHELFVVDEEPSFSDGHFAVPRLHPRENVFAWIM
jgi:hypothetical protein